jgi:CelD/BcsL family acetyltransferase involved in cellulose biosynthesis
MRLPGATPSSPIAEMRLVAWADLDPLALRAWSGWLDADGPDGTLASPFFRPELHALIDAARAGVVVPAGAPAGSAGVPIEVVVAQDGAGAPLAVLPFERDPQRPRHGWPAGRWLADYQGVVAAPGVSVDIVAMVKAAGLDAWQFDHVPVDQLELQPWRTGTGPSRQIDLRAGVGDAATSRPILRDAANARRRLHREVGAVRVDAHTDDPTVLAALLEWKSAQYRRTAVRDIFAVDWCRAAITSLASTDRPAFAGRLSALWAGEHLVSVHLGPCSYGRWHWFLPAYDPAFGRYSPGTVLLADLVGRSDDLGISIIDLGKGDEPYKRRFANAEVTVASGTVEVPSLARRARRAAGRLRRRVGR